MSDFPTILTPRLTLRQILLSDALDLIEQVNDPEIGDNILNIPFPYTEADAVFRMNFVFESAKKGDRFIFVVIDTKTDLLLGEIGLHLDTISNKAEFGYWIGKAHRGNGYASEAVKAILKFGFETLELNKIYATHFTANPASGKVLINNGMIKEGDLKDHYRHNGEYRTVAQYRLTREEYDNL